MIRLAREDEFPFLEECMRRAGGEVVELGKMPCWVAEEGGEVVGMLASRMAIQLEPLLVFSGSRMRDSRSAVAMYRAAERWIGDRSNGCGVHWFFAITRSPMVMGWARRLGWFRQYEGAALFIKHL